MPRYELGPSTSVTFAAPGQATSTGGLADVEVAFAGPPTDGGYTCTVAIPPFDPAKELAPSRLHAVYAAAPVPDAAPAPWFMDAERGFPIASEPPGESRDPAAGTTVVLKLTGVAMAGELRQLQIIREFAD